MGFHNSPPFYMHGESQALAPQEFQDNLYDYTWPQFQGIQVPQLANAPVWMQSELLPSCLGMAFGSKSLEKSPAGEERVCYLQGCSGKQFLTDSAFKKHIDKHKRPYKCTVASCTVSDFGNVGDLKRHQRQKHRKHEIICPVVSCKRHSLEQAFARKDNLREHMRRAHANTSAVTGDQQTILDDQAGGSDEDESMGSVNGELAVEEIKVSTASSLEHGSLLATLQELETRRAMWLAKMDGDIAAVKRVLALKHAGSGISDGVF